MREVVSRPRGEELPQRDDAEDRMDPAPVEIGAGEPPAAQRLEIPGPQGRELPQQLRQRPSRALALLGEAIVAIERPRLAVLADDERARDPVGLLAVDQV